MRLDLLVVCCLGLPVACTIALASPAAPTFTAGERLIVERNELLARAVTLDPWMVRRWLDETPVHPAAAQNAHPAALPGGLDSAKNPDISAKERGSAEATYDLIRLIRKAAPPTTKTP